MRPGHRDPPVPRVPTALQVRKDHPERMVLQDLKAHPGRKDRRAWKAPLVRLVRKASKDQPDRLEPTPPSPGRKARKGRKEPRDRRDRKAT